MVNLTFGNVITRWSFDPLVVLGVLVAGVLYYIGNVATRHLLPSGHRMGPRRWKSAMFYSSLALVYLALESPLDYLSAYFFWAHMIQHLVLIMLVAPLSLLGDPALPILRGLPLALRRRALSNIIQWGPARALGAAIGWLSHPIQASASFAIVLYAWHLPALYNLTLRNQTVHDCEHAMFLAVSILLWAQVIDQTQYRCTLGYGTRAVYVFLAAVENHMLSVVLAFAPSPLYAYANLHPRPANISAYTDQQIAGGIMWVPGMLLYGGALCIFLFKWLREQTLPNGVVSATGSLGGQAVNARAARIDGSATAITNGVDPAALLGAK